MLFMMFPTEKGFVEEELIDCGTIHLLNKQKMFV